MAPIGKSKIEISLALVVLVSHVHGSLDSGVTNQNQPLTIMNSRISEGFTVIPHTMPWQAALMSPKSEWLEKPFKAMVKCGASIICPKYVISAAHCSYIYKNKVVSLPDTISDSDQILIRSVIEDDAQPSSYIYKLILASLPDIKTMSVIEREAEPSDKHLWIGTHDLVNDLGIEYDIESISIHPTYANNNKPVKPPRRAEEWDCDVSLYKLKNPIDFSKVAMSIHLPDIRDHLPVGTIVTHSGWGLNKYGKQPWQLMAANVPLVEAKKCYNKKRCAIKEWTTRMACTGYTNGKHGTQPGDSGGPVSWLDANDKVKLFGVISGAFKKDPQYTFSTKLTDIGVMVWIKRITNNCNMYTCNQGNCMTGKKLNPITKRIFYGPKPVLQPLNRRFGFLDLLDSWESSESSDSSESSESSDSSESSESLEKPYKLGKPGRPKRMESCDF